MRGTRMSTLGTRSTRGTVPDRSAFEPRTQKATPLFFDTSGLYPYFYDRASQHEEITQFFAALSTGDLAFRPLFTNQYVIDELVSLLLSHANHETAASAVHTLQSSDALTILSVTDRVFDHALAAFHEYTDHAISLTDHTIAIQADAHDSNTILSYDDDFTILGFTVVPRTP